MTFLRCKDHTGHEVVLKKPPKRIVSLVPSQTELLFDLGLEENIVGVTKFCNRPSEKTRLKIKVGGTKNIREDVIRLLAPDLILGNKEENERNAIERLREHYPVWVTDVKSRVNALDMIAEVGWLTYRAPEAENLCRRIDEAFHTLEESLKKEPRKVRVAYFIWENPYMVVGSDTYIDHMLSEAGFLNVFCGFKRYPELKLSELRAYKPDVVLLSSEPYPFSAKHYSEFKAIFPKALTLCIDGVPFSWYGSSMLRAPAYFKALREKIFQYF